MYGWKTQGSGDGQMVAHAVIAKQASLCPFTMACEIATMTSNTSMLTCRATTAAERCTNLRRCSFCWSVHIVGPGPPIARASTVLPSGYYSKGINCIVKMYLQCMQQELIVHRQVTSVDERSTQLLCCCSYTLLECRCYLMTAWQF